MRPLRTIPHSTEFSAPSEQALSLACGLARARGARLIVLHVVEPRVYYGELGMTASLSELDHQAFEEWLARLCPQDAAFSVEPQVVEGGAAAEIVRAAREGQCDLIVMGSHGRTGLGRVVMGSVAEAVARRAPCPVLVSKGPVPGLSEGGALEPLFSTILFPTDLSERSREAYPVVLALADPGTRLIVLHVTEADSIVSDDLETALDERLRTLHPSGPGVHMEYRSEAGGAIDEILRVADESRCDLIVMTSHGRTGLDRLLMGSVAEAVFHGARCPVLIVRTARPETGSEVEVTGPKSVLVF